MEVNQVTLLKQILDKTNNQKYLFSCIEDLVVNGLDPSRFIEEKHRPSRQDITQYIASWFRHIGVSSDHCAEWLIDYSIEVLSKISQSSKSKIRHSTKSNIKYIYRSEMSFECGCENNLFKASCDINCFLYKEMSTKYEQKKATENKQIYLSKSQEISNEVYLEIPSVKDKYKEQFEAALKTANNHIKEGVSKREIVNLLNDSDFKTRTGRKWTYPILQTELKRIRSKT